MTSGRYGIRKSVRAAAADYGGQCAPDTADPYMVVFLNLKVRCSVGSEAESMSFSHSISANPIAWELFTHVWFGKIWGWLFDKIG